MIAAQHSVHSTGGIRTVRLHYSILQHYQGECNENIKSTGHQGIR